MPAPASVSPILNVLKSPVTHGLAGIGAGAAFGRHVTPQLFGYEDNPAAINMSMLLDAALLGGLGFMGPAGIKAYYKTMGPKAVPTMAGAVAGAELMPVGMSLLTKGTEAARAVAERPTQQDQLESILKLPETRGAGIGAALAALGAIGTGALRPRRESERMRNTGRIGMIKNDLLMYAIPAMIAGGLIGHASRD